MRIVKFGGSSVATAERIGKVVDIINDLYLTSPELIVVVSALGGVTDLLIKAGEQAVGGDESYKDTLKEIKKRHEDIAHAFTHKHSELNEHLSSEFKNLHDLLHGIFLVRELSKRALDELMSYGERLSTYLVTAGLQRLIAKAEFFDARKFIKTDRNFGSAKVNYEDTYALIRKQFVPHESLPVITGFIGSTEMGETTTLGRGGSDFTASLVAAALGAAEIQIWTDVDGVMTADPRKVKRAFPLAQMTYKEAMEISHFGAKVIYPPTIVPAYQANIPIRIKNSFNPAASGTLVSSLVSAQKAPICGISSISDITLLRVEGTGIVGVSGMSKRLFSALAERNINVMLITQGSSEHSICIAITPECGMSAKEAAEKEFAHDMQIGLIDPIIIETGLSIIAIVGEQMRDTTGVCGILFGALARNGINIDVIAQGSSQYNVSFVVKRRDEIKALTVIHEEFFLSPTKRLHVFLVGVGLIGDMLLKLIKAHQAMLQERYGLEISIIGVSNSKKMYISNQDDINVDNAQQLLQAQGEAAHLQVFIDRMKTLNLRNSIFVDCTASQYVSEVYAEILNANISIVTPNKRANSGSYQGYKDLQQLAKRKQVKFSYEANVGGGLPIISTINNLLCSGDKIVRIEAVLSGTLSYIFSVFMQGAPFSEVVKQAQSKGYTEPDPRDDLNGMDVMRKLLILARECGHVIELDDLEIQSFLPAECFAAESVDEFYKILAKQDDYFAKMREQCLREEKVLRYIALFENGKGTISLQSVGREHPFYNLPASDNIIALLTERYHASPLVIQGKGAGSEVTAGKVLAGIIDCGRE
jgi:aspartokinase/homoserine dehydrogenase 1